MKMYLSSYKLGNKFKKIKELIHKGKTIGYIPNALDFTSADPIRRKESIEKEIIDLKTLGIKIHILDLKNYFNKKDLLEKELSELGGVWVRGGNVYVLRQAMRLSGFDEIIKKLNKKEDFFYGGYSAGVCVLAPDLGPLKDIDDPNDYPYGPFNETIWAGLGVLDYLILPHYQSNHPESEAINKKVKILRKQNISFKTLRDGDVIITT